eukprot:5484-Heterococcus_DN1.PRE.2
MAIAMTGGDCSQMYYACCWCMFHYTTDCAVCADGYSKSIGYECSECKTGTKAGTYTALAALLSVLITGFVCLIQQLLGLNERKTDQQVKAKPPGCCMNIKLPSCCDFKLPSFCHLSLPGLLLKNFKMLASLPWSKLSTCLLFTH